jgi:hypothetical protein
MLLIGEKANGLGTAAVAIFFTDLNTLFSTSLRKEAVRDPRG